MTYFDRLPVDDGSDGDRTKPRVSPFKNTESQSLTVYEKTPGENLFKKTGNRIHLTNRSEF